MFIALIFVLCFGDKVYSVPALSHLLITRVGPCTDQKKVPIVVSEMSLHKGVYDSSLSGLVNVTKDIDNGWILLATMQKCHDIRNLDTCDFYKTTTLIKEGCVESKEAAVYKMVFQFVTPKMKCPIKAGSYKITEYPLFTGDSDLAAVESKISTSVFGYTYRMEGFDTDYDRILCVEAHLRMIYVRNHDWLDDHAVRTSTTLPPLTEPDNDDQDTDDKGDSDDGKGNGDTDKRNDDSDQGHGDSDQGNGDSDKGNGEDDQRNGGGGKDDSDGKDYNGDKDNGENDGVDNDNDK